MDAEQIRRTVQAVLLSIAPETNLESIAFDRPLREQIDLDSMDWLNVLGGLHERLAIEIPASDYGRLTSLDAIVAYLAARHPVQAVEPARKPSSGVEPLASVQHLVHGTPVEVRPMQAADMALEADFVHRLSTESRYKRFMVTVSELPKSKLRYLSDVDQVRHVALVATTQRDGQSVFLGVARYVVDPAGAGCEFAIAVDDAWRGTGLAGVLMHALIDVARYRGLKSMEGLVLASNTQMLKFTRQLGFTQRHEADDYSTVRVVLPLRPV